MSETNVLEKFIKDASEQIEKKKRTKAPPLNGQYRNRAWYLNLFKTMTADAAYVIVKSNIKKKTFAPEPEVAIATYKEFYNCEFQSKDEREAVAQRNEIERLKAEVEELKRMKAELSGDDAGSEDANVGGFAPPAGLTQEQFKPVFYEWYERAYNHKPNGGTFAAAWRTYNKNTEGA